MKNLLFVIVVISLFSFTSLDDLENFYRTKSNLRVYNKNIIGTGRIEDMGLDPISYLKAGAIIERFAEEQTFSKKSYFIPASELNLSDNFDGYMFYFGGIDSLLKNVKIGPNNLKTITLQFEYTKLIAPENADHSNKFYSEFKSLHQGFMDDNVLLPRNDLLILNSTELERRKIDLDKVFSNFRVAYPSKYRSFFIGKNALKKVIGNASNKFGISIFMAEEFHDGLFQLVMVCSNSKDAKFDEFKSQKKIYSTLSDLFFPISIRHLANGRSCIIPCPPCTE